MAGVTGRAPLSRAAIVAVGSEMLGAAKLDTNSLYITEQLNQIGIDVVLKSVVGDERDLLRHVFVSALDRAHLVVVCGGLGPTDDDVTREAVAAALDRPLAEDAGTLARLEARYAARGYPPPMPRNNRRQALVPAGAEMLVNQHGSAPGLWIEHGAKLVVLLPGPPKELKPMLTALVDARLRARTGGEVLVRRLLRVAGRIESQADEALQPLYQQWAAAATPVAATILAALGQIELHLSVRHAVASEAEAVLDSATAQVLQVLGADVFSTDGRKLEDVVGDALVDRGLWVAAAESCTGGLLTSRLTDVPGSSRYVKQSVVVYSNDAKTAALGVPAALLTAHGAVSEPVARAMAEGVRALAASDLGLGVTGIAGPGGGSPEKPVGTVAVALATGGGVTSRLFRFFGDREQVKFQASQAALDMVRRHLRV